MGTIAVHPTQRRVSCEPCRRSKSRCKRLHENDTHCARCMLVGVECVSGIQNKVGRPRRVLDSGAKSSKVSPKKAVAQVNTARPTPIVVEVNQTNSAPRGLDGTLSHNTGNYPVMGTHSISSTRDEVLNEALRDFAEPKSAWPPMGVEFLDQLSLVWETSSNSNQITSIRDPTLEDALAFSPGETFDASSPESSSPSSTYNAVIDDWALLRPNRNLIDATAASDTLSKLSKLNLDLEIRMTVAEANKSILNFESLTSLSSVFYINDTTLAEFMLEASHDFLRILAQLDSKMSRSSPQISEPTASTLLPPFISCHNDIHRSPPVRQSTSTSNLSATSNQALSTPIALAVTSIFVQLISLHELSLEHTTRRIERISIEPISPMPRLSSGGLPVTKPCVQGMLFAELVVNLQERIEQILGIGMGYSSSNHGLLSERQRNVLWSELDGTKGSVADQGFMRPTRVSNAYKTMAVVLKQLSLAERSW